MASFTYSLSGDFGGSINLVRFHAEIKSNVNINKDLDQVKQKNDNVVVSFAASLDGGEVTALDSLVSAHISSIDYPEFIFGDNYYFAKSAAISSTTGTSYLEKLKMITPFLTEGAYRVAWSYNWRYSSTSNSFYARVQLNDTETLSEFVSEPNGKDSDQSNIVYGFDMVNLSSGIHEFDVDFKSGRNNNTAYIWNVKIEMWEIPIGGI